MSSFNPNFGYRPNNVVYSLINALGTNGFYNSDGKYIPLNVEADPANKPPLRYDFPDAIEFEPVLEDGKEVWQMTDTGERDWFN